MALPLGALAVLAMVPLGNGPTLCPFALMTGIGCPGCGLTRAAASLARGDLAAAWTFHPLVWLALAWAVGFWTVGYLRRRGREVTLPSDLTARLLTMTGVLLLSTWLLRLATGTLPPV